MLAGLAAIPKEPIEAAEILGASKWRIFWEVQLPLLRPVILLALVLRFLEAMARISEDLGAVPGRPRLGDRDAAGLHLHDHLAVFRDLQGRGDVLHRHDDDDRHRAGRDPAAAAGEALARRHVRASRATAEADGDDQVAAPPHRHHRPLRRAQRLGADRVLSDLLDGVDLVQAGQPVVLLAAGLLPRPADARQLPNVWFGAEEVRRRRNTRSRRRSR